MNPSTYERFDSDRIVVEVPSIIGPDDTVLITGASGFIGKQVVVELLRRGFHNLRCFVRPTSDLTTFNDLKAKYQELQFFPGNLLSVEDCCNAVKDVKLVIHLAAGRAEKSFPDAYLNSVVTTRNLLDACAHNSALRRFVNVSSFVVYTNRGNPRRVLNESSQTELNPEKRHDPYCFSKVKQDKIVEEYVQQYGIKAVTVRPGYVYGPGKSAISGRVGISTFGIFLHLGGSNKIPITYVENCASAIVLAGLARGIEGQVFNVVDDDLPSSRWFLREYKKRVRKFKSIYVPHVISYTLCLAWEKYSGWSGGQLPSAFNRAKWHSFWKRTKYSNSKLKALLGWTPKVSTTEGLHRFFAYCRDRDSHA